MIYRVLVALIFAAGITAQFVNSNLGAKWFIYMTDQGICFLFLHFLLDACIVVARFTWEKSHPEYASYHANESLSGTYKLSWVLNSCFFNVALFISVIYWTVLHKCEFLWHIGWKSPKMSHLKIDFFYFGIFHQFLFYWNWSIL